MTQAEMGFTGERAGAPTGFFNDLSRRNILGGCVLAALAGAAVPAGAAFADVPKIGRQEWNAAMARYQAARARADHYEENVYRVAERIADLEGGRVSPHIGNEDDRLRDLESDADQALMNMPAPDLQALRWKLDRALTIEDGTLAEWGERYLRQTIADVARLLGEPA